MKRELSMKKTNNEAGYVAIVTALMIIPLMGFVAFAVDLGLWYNEASQIQRASDAAALAGVVVLPDLVAAQAEAEAVARRNGYEVNDPNIQVIVNETGPLQLSVDIIDTDIDLVFSSFFINNVDITRDSTAQYIKPIPLGSPANSFGNPSIAEALNPTSDTPQVWAAINAPYTLKAQGDPYSTRCDNITNFQNQCAAGSINDEYRDTGYWYAVDVPVSMIGTPVTVSIFDPALNRFSGSTACAGNTCEVGWNMWKTPNTGLSSTLYQVFDTDDSPYNWNNNPELQQAGCNQPTVVDPNTSSTAPNRNVWVDLCTFTPTTSGIYPVNVRTVDFPTGTVAAGFEQGRGNSSQSYSIKAVAPGAQQPRVYALGDMSIIVSAPAGPPPELFLMEINEAYDNKQVEIELFDAGEAAGISFLEFIVPDGVGGKQMAPKCTVIDNNNNETVLTPCQVMVSNSGTSTRNALYNNEWLRVVIDTSEIDPNGPYVCGNDCWWKVRYNLNTNNVPSSGNGTTDRTTWRAQVIGDPLALID